MAIERRFELRYGGINAVMFGLLGVGRSFTIVAVDEQALTVRMGWAFRGRISLANVRRVTRTERPFVGWGVHGWRGRWLVNGSLGGIVAIEIDPPVRAWVMFVPIRLRTLYLSLADPEAFLESLA